MISAVVSVLAVGCLALVAVAFHLRERLDEARARAVRAENALARAQLARRSEVEARDSLLARVEWASHGARLDARLAPVIVDVRRFRAREEG